MSVRLSLDIRSAPVPDVLPGIVGASARLRAAAAQVPLIAEADVPCLLSGETGTGKELFARAIHYLSPRGHRPFVPVNCGAIPDHLFENELFGHVRGAYTDASSQETGLLSFAENGTLFLDEVDALSLGAQVKLLRVLQEREYRPVGSAKLLRADVRVVAAANCDLRARVASRHFREDLYHRIDILRLAVPPLRERLDDVAPLAVCFCREFAAAHRRPLERIDASAIERLMDYSWPGNVRELQGALHRAVLMTRGSAIAASDLDLPGSLRAPAAPGTLKAAKNLAIRQFERTYLAQVLHLCEGNVSRAAQAAGKERRSFQRLLRKHQIAASAFRAS